MFTSRYLGLAAALLSLSACGPQQEPAVPSPAAATEAPAALGQPGPPGIEKPKPEVSQDFAGFGSSEPLPRADSPTRGVLAFLPKDGIYRPMDHWEQYDWTLQPKRSGHYRARLSYTLSHATLGVQLKFLSSRVKKIIQAAPAGHTVTLGDVFIPEGKEPLPLSVYATTGANGAGFGIKELQLVPIAEGAPVIESAADGTLTLLAKEATPWSETLRYDPAEAKQCLSSWTETADLAEWELQVSKPGRYAVHVTLGCDSANAGSEVAVSVAGQEARFTVQDTGGFQQWKEIAVGELEISSKGTHHLRLVPLKKAKDAIMDVQHIVLRPQS
jgi:hypothetical protein